MRIASALLLVAVALPTRSVKSQVQQGRTVSVRLPAYNTPVVLDTVDTQTHHEDAMRAAVLWAARKAFEELELPITLADSTRGLVISADLSLVRRLGKLRMSQILDCGTNLNGPIADQYRVRMAVALFVDSLGPSASEYRIAVAAGSQSLEGATRPPLACSSTGVLEERLAKLLSKKIWT